MARQRLSETSPTARLQVLLPEEMYAALSRKAEATNSSASEIARRLIKKYLSVPSKVQEMLIK